MMAIGAYDAFSRVVRMRNFRSMAPCRRRVGEGADDPTGLFVARAKDVKGSATDRAALHTLCSRLRIFPRESENWRPEHRQHQWLPFVDAKLAASFEETG